MTMIGPQPPPQHAPTQPLVTRPGALPPSPPNSNPSTGHNSMNAGMNAGRQPYPGQLQNGETLPIPRKFSAPPSILDEQLQIHHRVLRDYLHATSHGEPLQPHSRARDKLLRLSPTQFQELSTDVYDELLRRQDERRHPPSQNQIPAYLLPRANFHPKRNQARQKLATLAPKKFAELATDVLYELERRHPQFVALNSGRRSRSGSLAGAPPGRRRGSSVSRMYNAGVPPMPQPPPGVAGSLPAYVQGLRRPSVTSPESPYSPTFTNTSVRSGAPSIASANEYGRPLPKNLQGPTIMPSKSMPSMTVEDDGEQSRYDGSEYNFEGGKGVSSRRTTQQSSPYGDFPTTDYQDQISKLEFRVLDLENQLKQKDEETAKHQKAHKDAQQTLEAEQTRSATLKGDLEKQLNSASSLNASLQAELDSLRAANAALQNSVRSEPADSASNEWKSRYEALEQSYNAQQQLTDRVRGEAAQALQEMRLLASRSNDASDREETLHQQIVDLQAAVGESKARYAKTKAQLRNLRAISTGILYATQPGAGYFAKDAALRDPAGLVTDVAVTNYQIAVDELLKLSREAQPRAVLDYMRTIVSSVRSVTSEIDNALAAGITAGSIEEIQRKRMAKLKSRVSAAANNLITAARNYAVGNGLSPVSLVDVSVSNLTATIVELVKMAKVRSAGSLDATAQGQEDSGIEEGDLDGRSIGLGMRLGGHNDGEISPLASSVRSGATHGHGHSINDSLVSDRLREDSQLEASGVSGVGALLSNSVYEPPQRTLPAKTYQQGLYQNQYQQQQHQQLDVHGSNGIGMAVGGHGGYGNLEFEPGNSPGPEFGPTFEAHGGGHSESPFA